MLAMTVSGHRYELDSRGVQAALEGVLPEPIHEHFVVINGRRWPPKQVLALVTGLDRADFTTHQARRALTRLGFPAARALRSREHHMRAAQAARPSGPAVGGTGRHAADLGRGTAPVHRLVGSCARGRGAGRRVLAEGCRGLAGPARPACAVDVPGPGL